MVEPTGTLLPTIEKDVPVPPPRRRTGFTALIRKLQIGESVLLPMVPWNTHALAYRVLGKGNFRARKEKNGTRIWRIG